MTSNRRQFIEKSVGIVGGLSSLVSACQVRAEERPEVDPQALKQLRTKLRGTLVLSNDSEFESSRRVFYWNPQTQRKPVAIVQCAHEEDAVRSVEFAREHHLEVAVRSGGHSHLGWSTSDGLVIDLSRLKQITIDPARRIVRAQGGVLGGEVAQAAGEFGLVPVLGQCPGVGAMGVTLGGGLGWLSGMFGACCDNLVSARIVTASTQVIDVNTKTDPDLFWALRGAGANFGVATSFEARLQKIDSVLGGDVHFAARDARAVLQGFRNLMRSAPDEFQATLNLTPGERGVFINFCHAGAAPDAEQVLQRIRSIAKPIREMVERQDYAAFAQRTPATNPGNAPMSIARAIQTVYREEMTDEIIDILVDQLAHAFPEVVMGLSHYMHGEVCRIDPGATAFPHRQSHSIHLRAAFSWNDPAISQQRLAWGEQWLRSLRPTTGERLYANYQTYATDAGAQSLFAENFMRLSELKQKHDPDNFFRRNANIG